MTLAIHAVSKVSPLLPTYGDAPGRPLGAGFRGKGGDRPEDPLLFRR